jgi:hypothetical protein
MDIISVDTSFNPRTRVVSCRIITRQGTDVTFAPTNLGIQWTSLEGALPRHEEQRFQQIAAKAIAAASH